MGVPIVKTLSLHQSAGVTKFIQMGMGGPKIYRVPIFRDLMISYNTESQAVQLCYRWCNLLFGFVIVITTGASIIFTILEWGYLEGVATLVNGHLEL